MITVNTKCPQNHTCPLIRMCPQNAISQKGYGLPEVKHEKCTECGICVKNCPYRAFQKA